MIDETVLERLLHDEADTYVPPADGPEHIALLAAETASHKPRRAVWLAAAAAATVLGLVLVRPVIDGGGFGGGDTAAQPASAPRTSTSVVHTKSGGNALSEADEQSSGTGSGAEVPGGVPAAR